MAPDDVRLLLETLKQELASRPSNHRVALLGVGPAAFDVLQWMRATGLEGRCAGVYVPEPAEKASVAGRRPVGELAAERPEIVVVCSDLQKEELILSAVPHLQPSTRLLIGGFGHFRYRHPDFDAVREGALVPSFANGYPNCLVHLWQCLENAARLKLQGVVAEFGMFRGGTTMLLSRFVEQLGAGWKVFGFDTFDGFPPPRSPLDMYAHPDCVFLDEAEARRWLAGRDIEVVAGDIVRTATRLREEDVVLAFVDTDNYTSASAALEVIQDRVVPGGAIVFDHFTGVDRFLYTLGERMAARPLLDDRRYFNLHGTGVFLRQRT